MDNVYNRVLNFPAIEAWKPHIVGYGYLNEYIHFCWIPIDSPKQQDEALELLKMDVPKHLLNCKLCFDTFRCHNYVACKWHSNAI